MEMLGEQNDNRNNVGSLLILDDFSISSNFFIFIMGISRNSCWW